MAQTARVPLQWERGGGDDGVQGAHTVTHTPPPSLWLTRPHADVLLSPPVREVVGAEGALGKSIAWGEGGLGLLVRVVWH